MFRTFQIVACALLVTLCLPAVYSWSDPDPTRNPIPVPEGTYTAGQVTNGGQITGTVHFQGDVPALTPTPVPADFQTPCGHQVADESVVLDPETGAVANAIVYIADITQGAALPSGVTAQIDQHGCHFVPHVLVVPRGSTLRIMNSDQTLHNVHLTLLGRNTDLMNSGMPPGSRALDVPMRRPGLVQVSCDVHSWMRAYVVAANHPYYAVTGADGSFRLENVPAGNYTVRAWHERLAGAEAHVTVAAGAAATATLTLQP